ncbi:MAG: bifunctional hydroxymethylpyrimidine kinase/phosphomethylpyrimidine kinase, partial [Oscillospiraceae bacterium]|nr:bifunctional hydroxymethylpyrimidine kinase/phosphomethylpyrimidine kinase [Oscillospiraceae bacterium]
PRIHPLKPSGLEAELLSGIPIVDRNSARRAARRLIDLGVQRVFISLGKEGFLAAADDETVWQPAPEAKVVNVTGAGDALMAAIAWSYQRGENLSKTAAIGAAAAAITIESADSISPALSGDAVLRRAQDEA